MIDNERKIKWFRRIIFCTAICMIGFGIARGEASLVLAKATSICTQCIGL